MNYRKLNTFSNLFFVFLVSVGLVYTVFLFKLFVQTTPGIVMLLVFFLDSIRSGYDFFGIRSIQLVLGSSLINVITQVLIYRYVRSLLVSSKIVSETRRFVKNLKQVSIKDKVLTFRSNTDRAFTSGLLQPMVCLPSGLGKTHSKIEVSAITLHEKQHSLAYDPLKSLIANCIKNLLPPFPFKKWIFEHYGVLVELTADAYAEKKLNKRLPIVSALFKQYQKDNLNIFPAVGFLDSQSERIHILVGEKSVEIKGPLLISSIAVVTLFMGTLLLKNEDIFYYCPHINSCVKNLIAPKSTTGVPSMDVNKSILDTHR